MKVRISICLIFLIIICVSCKENIFQHINKIGKHTTIVRYAAPFHSVQINDDIEVYFIFNSNELNLIEICGGENLLQHISTEVIDSVLVIKNNNKLKWTRNFEKSKIECNIYLNNLKHIVYNGISNIYFVDTLKTSRFEIESWSGMGDIFLNIIADSMHITLHTGATKTTLCGASNFAHYYINGYGTIEATNCIVKDLSVHARGTNNVFVNASKTLGVTIDYIGNVYYKGSPHILWLAENNKGKLIKVE